jgi:O-methyltransferase
VSEAARLYIELLKRCVSNSIYDDDLDMMRGQMAVDEQTGRYVVLDSVVASMQEKYLGQIWPTRAHTMIGMPRLDNLQQSIEQVLQDRVPGDLIETGVWRGGASIFMRGVLKAYGVADRQVWVADSFEGLPPPDLARYPKESPMEFFRHEALAVSLEEVRANFARYGLLDEQVRFLKGWFRDTLPGAPIGRLSILRLDGDLYESTMDALAALYPKLSPGGFVIIDDYNAVEACNEAVHDFLKEQGIATPLTAIPGAGAFWRK